MFYLWVGIMAGILLAYLSANIQALGSGRPWRSLRWWLAGAALILLLTPIVWDSVRYGSGNLGVMEAVKDVLLPCAAGIGFGIWMYLIVVPLPSDPSARGVSSFIPIAVAMLLVMLIVSEERYSWLDRFKGSQWAAAQSNSLPGHTLPHH